MYLNLDAKTKPIGKYAKLAFNIEETMKTFWIALISIISIVALLGAVLFLVGYFKAKPGGINVETSVDSNVYLNGQFVGKTPFKGAYKAESVLLKAVPIDTQLGYVPFETKLTLISGIETVVRREFGKTEDVSSGDIIFFEKEKGKTSIVVISTPADASVSLDGVPRGFSPFKTSTISPAEHQIIVKAPGYLDRVMTVNAKYGYRLTVYAKLGKANENQLKTPETLSMTKTFVEILNTSTGFLRVRNAPGTDGQEIAQVTPGSKYLFLSTDVASGWYEIQYQNPVAGLPKGVVGWVSSEFARKIEESVPTPVSTP